MLLPLIAVACYLFGALGLGFSAYQGDSHHGRGGRIAAPQRSPSSAAWCISPRWSRNKYQNPFCFRMLKSLPQPFVDFPFPVPVSIPDVETTGIAIDSRVTKPGNLFVAMQGGTVDGHLFMNQAIDNGASALVGDRDISGCSVPYLRVVNSRQALTWLCAAFYNWPARQLTVIGVTGTDGKTTTANLIHKILLAGRLKAGMISTVNAVIGDEVLDTGFHVTTPDAHDVQRYLAKIGGGTDPCRSRNDITWLVAISRGCL